MAQPTRLAADVLPIGPVSVVPRARPWRSLAARWWSKVDMPFTPQSCWTWRGGRNGDDYGTFMTTVAPKKYAARGAHVVGYELMVGSVPAGLEIDHLCRNRACVRPDHLDVVTHAVNVLRSEAMGALAARRTTCPNGHPYDMFETGRRCRACRLANRRKAQIT